MTTAGTTSLVRSLGEGLALDPLRAYCELVDRAIDACERRIAIDSTIVPSILVSTQSFGGVAHVSITDNGEAFEADAFRELYQVIQAGRLGAVKRALADAADPSDVVGKFGAALMATFLLGDRVVITARHHGAAADEAVKFTCDSRTYNLETTTAARVGTQVLVRVRRDRQRLGTVEMIRETLAKHAIDARFPVRVGADPQPINVAA